MLLLAWSGLQVLSFSGDFDGARMRGGAVAHPPLTLLLALVPAGVVTFAVALAVRLARRTPAGTRGWAVHLAVHAACAAALAVALLGIRLAARATLASPTPALAAARDADEASGFALLFLVAAGLAHAVVYAGRFRRKEAMELRLQASLSRAELERTSAELRMLKMQLNPHFLFNSLHAVAALIGDAPEAAERLVVRLSELL
ncbi:MAG TPA: histidine kinase, partial [Longimicrobiaceae bacterium]|nr:histidine kinase [Longimicrobiaceae bacterium]